MKKKATKALRLALFALLGVASIAADCEGNITADPTFRDWCGNSLCAWSTVYGNIQRVPTWNENDFGVSFLDAAGDGSHPAGTQIMQVTEEQQAPCILFTSLGDIAPDAQMSVSVDFDNDGTIDYTAPLGTANWKEVQTEITAPPSYHGITFYVTKSGTGTAVLAEMRIQSTTGCTAPAPKLQNLSLGAVCSSSNECASGLVCFAASDGGVQSECSQCAGTSCAGELACEQYDVFLPFQCGPGRGLGLSGAPCVSNGDCQSGSCEGAKPAPLILGDAGPCDLNALPSPDVADGGSNNNCTWYGALGGTCR
jgi:hypothetical protein